MKSKNAVYLSTYLDIIFKINFLLGGSVVAIYITQINHFPSGISAGDGFLLFFISGIFTITYLFFIIFITSLGLSLRKAWIFIHCLIDSLSGKSTGNKKTKINQLNYTKITRFSLIYAFIGWLIFLTLSYQNPFSIPRLLLTAWACSLLYTHYLRQSKKIKNISFISEPTRKQKERFRIITRTRNILISSLIILPAFVSGVLLDLVNGTMRVANLRVENVVIHTKEPYSTVLESHNLRLSDSIFGEEYKRKEKVNILLGSIGTETIFEVSDDSGRKLFFSIPDDHIHVIPN